MATQYQMGEDGAQLPVGVVLAHTLYGEPQTQVTHAYTAAPAGVAVVAIRTDDVAYEETPEPPRPVWEDGIIKAVPKRPVPTNVDRTKKCRAKNDTCMGWRINGSDYCAAHAGKLKAFEFEVKEVDVEPPADA